MALGLAGLLEPGARDVLRHDVSEELRAFAAAALGDVPAEVVVEEGDVPSEIVAQARARNADLIALGTHGHGGFARLTLGSTAEKVLRKATCPVLTIPPTGDIPAARFRRILCPTDLSPLARRALEYSRDLALGENGRVRVLHVIHPVPPPLLRRHPKTDFDVEGYRQALHEEATEDLRNSLPRDSESWVETAEVRWGKPSEVILAAAQEWKADVVAMGIHGHAVPDLVAFGSTAQQVVRHASCPILTLRENPAAEQGAGVSMETAAAMNPKLSR
jgi:nucleotide-binding universal stress UspA family protein